MTTTDANGIQFLQDTDNIAPFQTLINGLQTATSTAIANNPYRCTSTTHPTGATLHDGMLIWETDTKQLRYYSASTSTWAWAGGAPVTGSITPGAGVTLSNVSLVRVGALVAVQMYASNPSGFATNATIGTLPAAFCPAVELEFGGSGYGSGQPLAFRLAVTGQVSVLAPGSITVARLSTVFLGA